MKETIRLFYSLLAKINKVLLPRYSHRDLNKLSKTDKMIIGYRYWVTKNSLK